MPDSLPFTVQTSVVTLAVTVEDRSVTRINLNARGVAPPRSAFERQVAAELAEYAAGERRDFSVPVAFEGTAFDREVWRAVAAIPYGETVSYAEIARRVGRPRAYRAVGAANGRNPIPIIIPCHRVVASDGGLGGYGGGLPLKRRLLELEAGAVNDPTGNQPR
jgi:methylated-DNA-[protein]-cysteine S-methyltransferase